MVHSLRWVRTAGLALGFLAFMTATAGGSMPPESDCAAAEVHWTGKKAYKILDCYRDALRSGEPVNQDCISGVEKSFTGHISHAQDKGDCLSSISASELEDKVNCFVFHVLCQVTNGALCPNICEDSCNMIAF